MIALGIIDFDGCVVHICDICNVIIFERCIVIPKVLPDEFFSAFLVFGFDYADFSARRFSCLLVR